jgi:hypothetical protein
LSRKSNTGVITIPNFKLYYRATAIKTSWYWHKDRHEDLWNKVQDPNINLCNFTHLIFDKVSKMYYGEKTASLTNIAGKAGHLAAEN